MADAREDDEPAAELVMPFVACASNGGPFDDGAYTAGFEMGLLVQHRETAWTP